MSQKIGTDEPDSESNSERNEDDNGKVDLYLKSYTSLEVLRAQVKDY